MTRLLHSLPQGGTLPRESWERRHRGILVLLWAHVAIVPVYGVLRDKSLGHSLLEALVVAVPAGLAAVPRLSQRERSLAAVLGLLSSSAVLVHLSGGLIEMHFHFFVMVVVVSLYQDWIPFLAAVAYVFVHHGLFGVIDAGSVYNHPAAEANPWKWAGIHAFFVAGISAASLVNWRLNETNLLQRRRAEERLREESRIVERLDEVGRMLASDLDLDQVVQRVTDVATELTGAQFGAFFYNSSDQSGNSYLLYTLSGVPAEAFAGFPMPRATGLFGPTFAGEDALRLDDVTADERYGRNPPYHGMPPGHLPVRSYLAVPVISRGSVIGGLFFGHPEPARFGESEERVARGVAAHAAVAVQNARLYAAERQAREREGAAQRRLSIVAEASRRLLSTSLEYESMLRELTSLTVPQVADGCWIDLVQDGRPCRVASAVDAGAPDQEHSAAPAGVITGVLRTGRPLLLEAGNDALAELGGPARAVTSATLVPLGGRDGPIGVMTLFTVATSGRRLGPDELQLAEELGRRAATALENAELFAGQRAAAETLQHSLLPERLPAIPGLDVGVRYLPGAAGVEVGGDWYDLIALPDGCAGLVMGDVVGRGVPAAALMGRLRNSLRAYALDGHPPAEVLRRLNNLLQDEERPEHMATVTYAVFDPANGQLRVANAGHPPAALRAPGGNVTFLDAAPGVPLGAMAGSRYGEVVWTVEPGSTLVLYTDGLVEARGLSLDEGIEELRVSLAEGGDGELDEVCDTILHRASARRISRDDTALLVVRSLPLGDVLRFSLPAQPASLKSLRRVLRRWLEHAGASDEEIFDVLVATGEACSNAIRHASLTGSTSFELEARRGEELRITIRDQGRWRPRRRGDTGGRGIAIMDELMDSVDVRRGPPETVVTLRRALAVDRQPVMA